MKQRTWRRVRARQQQSLPAVMERTLPKAPDHRAWRLSMARRLQQARRRKERMGRAAFLMLVNGPEA